MCKVKSVEFTEYVNKLGVSCVGVKCDYPGGLTVKCLEEDDCGEQMEFHYLVEGLLETELGAYWDSCRGYILAANGGEGLSDESVEKAKNFFVRYGFAVTEQRMGISRMNEENNEED